MDNLQFNIEEVINKLKTKRKIFVSEADLQLEIAWIIKEIYSSAKVRLEYAPRFNPDMHIDILVILNNKWIPIELKYKTKARLKLQSYEIDGEYYHLKNHGAKDVNCYLYLKDIQSIELIKENVPEFKEGYTIFITNEQSYCKKPSKDDCVYKEFSLEEGIEKTGILNWSKEASPGTKKNCEEPIKLNHKYKMNWKVYSKIDDSNTGLFLYLVNKI